MNFSFTGDVILVAMFVAILVVVGLYFLNKKASKRMATQSDMLEKTKQTMQIYVIDKKKDKITKVSMPKGVSEQMPWYSKMLKMYFVKVKVGPQIITMMCDKNAFNQLHTKKSYNAEVSGMYIAGFKGMKTANEIKNDKKAKKSRVKQEKKDVKKSGKK